MKYLFFLICMFQICSGMEPDQKNNISIGLFKKLKTVVPEMSTFMLQKETYKLLRLIGNSFKTMKENITNESDDKTFQFWLEELNNYLDIITLLLSRLDMRIEILRKLVGSDNTQESFSSIDTSSEKLYEESIGDADTITLETAQAEGYLVQVIKGEINKLGIDLGFAFEKLASYRENIKGYKKYDFSTFSEYLEFKKDEQSNLKKKQEFESEYNIKRKFISGDIKQATSKPRSRIMISNHRIGIRKPTWSVSHSSVTWNFQ